MYMSNYIIIMSTVNYNFNHIYIPVLLAELSEFGVA